MAQRAATLPFNGASRPSFSIFLFLTALDRWGKKPGEGPGNPFAKPSWAAQAQAAQERGQGSICSAWVGLRGLVGRRERRSTATATVMAQAASSGGGGIHTCCCFCQIPAHSFGGASRCKRHRLHVDCLTGFSIPAKPGYRSFSEPLRWRPFR